MGYGSEDFDLAQTKLRALGALLLAADENTVDDVHEGLAYILWDIEAQLGEIKEDCERQFAQHKAENLKVAACDCPTTENCSKKRGPERP